jgi:RES domain-containing protein
MQSPTIYHLDKFSLEDVQRWKRGQEEFIRFYWDWYTELAFQRGKIMPKIKAALLEASTGPFEFSGYQRAVKYRWSNDPLSVAGSILDIGGRFNIGDIDRQKFPIFPALYLGEDRSTAMQELLQVDPKGAGGLSAEELALTDGASISVVSVYGSLETVIDLEKPQRLKAFVDLIKDFKTSDSILRAGKKLKIEVRTARIVDELMSTLLDIEWRKLPMHVDVPGNPQIFGQLISEAGIEGISYPSKYPGKKCLVVYPQNFHGPDSFVQLADVAPKEIKRIRLDSKTGFQDRG